MNVHDAGASRGAKLAPASRIDIAYSETGDGPPLVLSKGLRLDRPGLGGSPVEHVDTRPRSAKHLRQIAP